MSNIIEATAGVAGQTIEASEEAMHLDDEISKAKGTLKSTQRMAIGTWVLCLIVLVARLFIG